MKKDRCPHCMNPETEHAFECVGIEARRKHDPMKTVVIMATFPNGEQIEEFAIVKEGRVYPFGPDYRDGLRRLTERIACKKDAIEDYHNYNLNEVKYRILREVTL